jgi:hypothetical protein
LTEAGTREAELEKKVDAMRQRIQEKDLEHLSLAEERTNLRTQLRQECHRADELQARVDTLMQNEEKWKVMEATWLKDKAMLEEVEENYSTLKRQTLHLEEMVTLLRDELEESSAKLLHATQQVKKVESINIIIYMIINIYA